MNAGKLKHHVNIERRSTIKDAHGGDSSSVWHVVGTAYVALKPLSGREYFQGQANNSDISHEVTMRYRADINSRDRLVSTTTDRVFNIDSIINVDERNKELKLMCKEVL